jgi:hypothetical protein
MVVGILLGRDNTKALGIIRDINATEKFAQFNDPKKTFRKLG